MTKDEFFKDLQEIVKDPLTVTGTQIMDKNMWTIAIPHQLVKEISTDEFTIFMHSVIQNRKEQSVKLGVDLLLYAWIDYQTRQFRFSVIAQETPLPFQCEMMQVRDLQLILHPFFQYICHDEEDLSLEEPTTMFMLYTCLL